MAVNPSLVHLLNPSDEETREIRADKRRKPVMTVGLTGRWFCCRGGGVLLQGGAGAVRGRSAVSAQLRQDGQDLQGGRTHCWVPLFLMSVCLCCKSLCVGGGGGMHLWSYLCVNGLKL